MEKYPTIPTREIEVGTEIIWCWHWRKILEVFPGERNLMVRLVSSEVEGKKPELAILQWNDRWTTRLSE